MLPQQVIFFRNLFLRVLVVGVVFAILYVLVHILFWGTWISLIQTFLGVDEKDSTRMILGSFLVIRIIIIFFMLVPALALHWTSKVK